MKFSLLVATVVLSHGLLFALSPEFADMVVTNYVPSNAAGDAPEGEEYATLVTAYDHMGCPTNNIDVVTTRKSDKADVEDGFDGIPFAGDSGGACGACGACTEATVVENGCISFFQRFGRSALHPELPAGRLLICEEFPSGRILTPKCLQYDSPFERKFYGLVVGPAIVRRPGRRAAVYYNGLPAQGSSFSRSSVSYLLDEDLHRETFEDRSSVLYSGPDALYFETPGGVRIPRAESGAAVLRGADGAIRQVYSEADGLLDVTAQAGGFTVAWYPPSGVSAAVGADGLHAFSGDPVKTFVFTAASTNSLSLAESRPGSAPRSYSWTWSGSGGSRGWTFVSGSGSDRRVHRRLHDAEGETETVLDSAGAVVSSRRVYLTRLPNNNRPASAVTATGRLLYSCAYSDADPFRSRVASVAEELGATVSYSYDGAGRVTRRLRTAPGLPAEETVYAYRPYSYPGAVDYRPVATTNRVGGVVISTSSFAELFDASGFRHEISERGGLVTVRVFYPVDGAPPAAARGRLARIERPDGGAESFAYAANALGGITTTATRGRLAADGSFAEVPGKSTRTVSATDRRANEVRVESHVLTTDGTWRLVSWEEREYDAAHRVVRTAHSNGRTSSAEWICTGPLWQVDRDGVAVTNAYDSLKRLVRSVRHSPLGVVTNLYAYDAAGRRTSRTKSAAGLAPRVETTAYDAEGRVASRTDSAGRTTSYAYSADGRTMTETLANGATRTTVRDAYGRVVSVTGSAVTPEWRTYGVDASGEWERTALGTPGSARATTVWRDGLGRAWREERPGANGSTLDVCRLYGWTGQLYDELETGRPARSYEYDGLGNLVATTLAAGGVSRTHETDAVFAEIGGEVWSVSSNLVYTGDASIAPISTSTRRRLSGLSSACESHVVSVDAWGGEGEEWTSFDAEARAETTYRRVPGVANTAHSVALDGRTVREVSFAAVTNTAAYDAYGRVVRRTDGADASTSFAYDARGFLASVEDPLGAATTYGYDLMGNRVSETDALGSSTLRAYDLQGRLVREEGAVYPVDYAYDVFGDRVAMTTWRDAAGLAGDTTRWLRDEATGAVTNKVYADGSRVRYAYTDDGRLAERTWARGVKTWYAYDGWGNLVSTVYSDATPSVECEYDALGRLVVCEDAAGATWTAYGDRGEKASEFVASDDAIHMTDFHYDAYGRDAGRSFDGERRTALSYDPDTGRLSGLQAVGSPVPFAWSYDAATGCKSSLAYPNGVSAQWTYDARGDLVRVRNGTADSAVSRYDYTYDAAGRRTRIAKGGTAFAAARSDDYGYNARGELVSAVEPDLGEEYAYAYDDIGNRLVSEEPDSAKTYVANALNQYTAIADGTGAVENPAFDLDGNQTRVVTKTGTWQVTYNGENRPVLWSNGATNIVMAYDRMGRRVAYDADFAGAFTLESKRFSYDGYLLVHEERRATDLQPEAVACDYVWDPTEPVATRPLVFRTQSQSQLSPAVLYYTHDGNKNVSELVTPNATVAAHYEYAPFGALTVSSGPRAFANPFRFSSEYADDVLALVYYNYRHYDPIKGRWTGRDPAPVFPSGSYSFLNNRCGRVDRFGLYGTDVHFYFIYAYLREGGWKHGDALEAACGSQYPDTGSWSATPNGVLGAVWEMMTCSKARKKEWKLNIVTYHNFNGLDADGIENYRKCIRQKIKDANGKKCSFRVGLLLHALADTYAHLRTSGEAYDNANRFGHAGDGTFPDDVQLMVPIYSERAMPATRNSFGDSNRWPEVDAFLPIGESRFRAFAGDSGLAQLKRKSGEPKPTYPLDAFLSDLYAPASWWKIYKDYEHDAHGLFIDYASQFPDFSVKDVEAVESNEAGVRGCREAEASIVRGFLLDCLNESGWNGLPEE